MEVAGNRRLLVKTTKAAETAAEWMLRCVTGIPHNAKNIYYTPVKKIKKDCFLDSE